MSPSTSLSTSPASSSRTTIEQEPLLPDEQASILTPHSPPMDILRAMSAHTRTVRSSPASSTSIATSSRRSSDIESGGSDWAYFLSKRRQTRRTTYILIGFILSSGLVYTFIDNFLLADWVSSRSRFTPSYLGGSGEDLINVPDHPDSTLDAADWLGSGVIRIPNDESHVLVPNHLTPPPFELLSPRRRFPSSTLVPFYSSGTFPLEYLPPIPVPTLDIIYTFVNASSPVLQEAKEVRMEVEGLGQAKGGAHHWRDNGELRGSIRSAALFFGDGLRKIHVISADFELDSMSPASDLSAEDDDDEEEEPVFEYAQEERPQWRVGQVPSWLETSGAESGVQWHFHSEIFRLPSDQGRFDTRLDREWESEKVWRDEALPSFNSFQIEGKVGWVNDLSENFIYSNDDMFFLRDLNPSDFHHPILGSVFRVAPNNVLLVSPTMAPDLKSDPGEWGGLRHANFLLSKRFYPKSRIYLSHVPKSMTRSIAHETSIMFADALSISATRGFRTSKRGVGDVHFAWLATHLQIERWREALLWSWAVAKLGGSDGVWKSEAREAVWDALRISEVDGELPDLYIVTQEARSTLDDMDETMVRNNWTFPAASVYQFSSMDGHLPFTPANNAPPQSCVFSLSHCLSADFFSDPTPLSAADMFSQLVFVRPECGDCLIMALTVASGERGLSAFLPTAEQVFEPEVRARAQWEREEPMLPLVDRWQDGNFTLSAVVRPGQDKWDEEQGGGAGAVGLLNFCVKLLSRYAYSIADSPTHFGLARNPVELSRVLESFKPTDDYVMGCINDDQPDSITGNESTQVFGAWMKERFGGFRVGWEKQDWPWIQPHPAQVVADLPDIPAPREDSELRPAVEALLKAFAPSGRRESTSGDDI